MISTRRTAFQRKISSSQKHMLKWSKVVGLKTLFLSL